MPTTVTKSIGTATRDYSTLQSWEDASPADLTTADQIWRGECYNDSEFTAGVLISGITTDSTRYVELTTATGQSFRDHANKRTNALAYNQSYGVGVRASASSHLVQNSVNYTKISKLQMKQESSLNYYALGNANNTIVGTEFFYNIAVSGPSNTYRAVALQNGIIYECLVVNEGAGGIGISIDSTGEVHSCTVVVPSPVAGSGTGISVATGSAAIARNCAVYGWGSGTAFTSGGFSNSDYNSTNDTAAPGSNSQTSKTYANQFENSASDWRAKAGADLLNSGTIYNAVRFVSASTIAASTGADITCTYSGSATTRRINDLQIGYFLVRDQDDTITWPTGWSQVDTQDRSTVSRSWVGNRLITNTSETSMLFDKSTATADTYGVVALFRGTDTSTWFDTSWSKLTTTNQNDTMTGITTSLAGCMVIGMFLEEDNLVASLSVTATDPATITSLNYQESATGADGALTIHGALRTSAGATGNISVGWDTIPDGWHGYVNALRPGKMSTVDITGLTRSTTTPTIGTWEYSSANKSDAVPQGTLRLTGSAPVDVKTKGFISEPIPQSSLRLTGIAPTDVKTKGFISEPVPSANLNLTRYAPGDYAPPVAAKDPVPPGFLTLTGFAPVDIKVKGFISEPIPPGQLTLTPFSPEDLKRGGFVAEPVPPGQLSLVPFSPSDGLSGGAKSEPIPQAQLSLTSYAPADAKYGGIASDAVPQAQLNLYAYAPSDVTAGIAPPVTPPARVEGGGPVKPYKRRVVIDNKVYTVASNFELIQLLNQYIAEQEEQLFKEKADLIKSPKKKSRIKVITNRINEAKTKLVSAIKNDDEELLLMLLDE